MSFIWLRFRHEGYMSGYKCLLIMIEVYKVVPSEYAFTCSSIAFKWYFVTFEIAQVVERWRGMQEDAGSNPNRPFLYNSCVLFICFCFLYEIIYFI